MAKLKLSAKYQAEVDHSCQMEGGDRPFLEYYRTLLDNHMPAIINNSAGKYDSFSEEYRTADVMAGLIEGMPQMVWGYAKRIAQDSPQELAPLR